MSDHSAEAASIARTPEPRTRQTLGRDLRALGIEAGMALLVHSAPSRIGWTVGGVESAIQALMDVLTPDGTLMMPSFSGQLSGMPRRCVALRLPAGEQACCLPTRRSHLTGLPPRFPIGVGRERPDRP